MIRATVKSRGLHNLLRVVITHTIFCIRYVCSVQVIGTLQSFRDYLLTTFACLFKQQMWKHDPVIARGYSGEHTTCASRQGALVHLYHVMR